MQKKLHLVINALMLQDHNRYRAFGRYTYEVIKHVNALLEEENPIMNNFSGVTLLAAKSPYIRQVLDFPLHKIAIHTVPILWTKRNIIKYFYYNTILRWNANKLFQDINKRGEASVYFLPRHQISTHPLADYTVTMVHDFIPVTLQHFHDNPVANFLLGREHNQYMKQLESTDMIITNSRYTADVVKEYIHGHENVVPIYLGSTLFEQLTPEIEQKPAPFANKYFVYYGGFDYNKNIPGILSAFGAFIRTYEDTNTTQLVLVGGEKQKAKILEIAKHEGIINNIVLTKYINDYDLIHYLIHSQGLFRLSFAEGFGLPELETMSLGVPVISADIPPIREIFKEHAMLHAVDDTQGIINNLHRLAKNKLGTEELITAKQYAQSFTWRKTIETMMQKISDTFASQTEDSNSDSSENSK